MTVAEFWRWFESNERALHAANAAQAADLLEPSLRELNPGLGVEVADLADGREVIVTAYGDRSCFDSVRSLVQQAPPCPGWTFQALKPARGFEFALSINGVRIEAGRLGFDPLSSERLPTALGVRVYVPGSLVQRGDIADALRLIIATGIGEEAAARIRHVEAADQAQQPDECLPIGDLAQYVAWHCKKHGQSEG